MLAAMILLLPAWSMAQEDDSESRRVKRLGDVTADEWEMDLSVPASAGDTEGGSDFDLPDPEQNQKLQNLLSTLATRPENSGALAALDEFLTGVLAEANQLADERQLEEAHHLLRVVQNVNPHKQGLADAFQRLESLRNVGAWLAMAATAMDEDRVLEPENDCGLHFLERVLAVDPDNPDAYKGLERAQAILVERALAAARELDFELAESWLYEASLVSDGQQSIEKAQIEINNFREYRVAEIHVAVQKAIESGDFDLAEFTLIDLIALVGNDERVQHLRTRLETARRYGRYSPGEIIRDLFQDGNGSAPAVVVIKSGSFLMGSPETEQDRNDNEGPQHRVTLSRGFAIGQYEVTVDQFRQFIQATGFRTQAETIGRSRVYDERSGRIHELDGISWKHDYKGKDASSNEPVLHVDWYDAQAYLQWLSRQTGQHYRLPSEAEFEYAIRAGTVTRYWWGDDRPGELVENLTGTGDQSVSGRVWSTGFRRYDDGYWGPAPVGVFQANALGLHDMAGNVSEWVEDCWHQTYTLAPADGSAWVNAGCQRRVVRGGYWASSPDQARSAARISARSILTGPRVGFRVVRDL